MYHWPTAEAEDIFHKRPPQVPTLKSRIARFLDNATYKTENGGRSRAQKMVM